MANDDVELTIGSSVYGGWEAIDITRSIESVAGCFSLTVSERWPAQQVRAEVRQGDACKVSVGGVTVISGYVDDVEPSYDKGAHSVKVAGRDKTGDLVDNSAPYIGFQRFNADVVGLISDICKPFGIPVTSQVAGLKPVPEFAVHPGQTAFEAIGQLASFAAVLPMSDGNGTLILTRAGLAGSNAQLKLGGNILKGTGKFSAKDRHSDYTVLGQANGGDNIDPNMAIGGVGKAKDAGVTRYRPLVIIADFMAVGNDAYQQRAQWEATVRAGRAYYATYTVRGWHDANGRLWTPNALAPVSDDWLAFHDTLLISSVHLSKSSNGTMAELTVTRKQSFELIPMPLGSGIYDATPSGNSVAPPAPGGQQ